MNTKPYTWSEAALRAGEELADTGPDGYYDMNPEQWTEYVISEIKRLREIEWMYQGLCE